MLPFPERTWQKPAGALFEILPKPNTHVYQKPTVPSPQLKKPPN